MSDDSQTKKIGEESDVKIEDTEDDQATQQSENDKFAMETKRKRTNKFAEDDEMEILASEVESVASEVKEKKKRGGGGRKISRNDDKPLTNKRRK